MTFVTETYFLLKRNLTGEWKI